MYHNTLNNNSSFIAFSINLEKKILETSVNKFNNATKKQQYTATKHTFSFASAQLRKSRVFSAEVGIETLLLTDGSLLVPQKSTTKKEIQKSFFTFLISKNDLSLYRRF